MLDKSPNFDQFLRRMERATYAVRLRSGCKRRPPTFAPMWVDDSNLRYRAPPGTSQAGHHASTARSGQPHRLRLVDLSARSSSSSLTGCAVAEHSSKMHHTIVDGEGGVQLSLQFLDFERDVAEPPPLDPELIAAAEEAAAEDAPSPDFLRDMLNGGLRLPIGLLKQVKDLLMDPTGIPEAGSAAADTVRGVMQQLGDTDGARSPLWTKRSLQSRLEVLRTVRRDSPRQAAGRHAQHCVPRLRGRGRRALPRRNGLTGGDASFQHGHQYPY